MNSDDINDDQIRELIRENPDRLVRLQSEVAATQAQATSEPKQKKSKKADIVELHILDLVHQHYDSTTSKLSGYQFNFDENVDSAGNKLVVNRWKSFLLNKRPQIYKNEDWSDHRLDRRLKTFFRSRKASGKLTEGEKNDKKARDRRRNRCNDKKIRRISALKDIVKDGIIPEDEHDDVLAHLLCPSEEETDSENENGGQKVVKLAPSPYRSDKLLEYYKLIDDRRAASRKGGAETTLKRTIWHGHSHPPPVNAAAWTLKLLDTRSGGLGEAEDD